jgi:predicted metal-binding protein
LDITATSPSPDSNQKNDSRDGVVVFVCRNCRSEDDPNADPRPGSLLSTVAIEKAGQAGIQVRSVNCLANCKRGLSASIRSADGWSYIFGGLTLEDADDLITGAQLLADAQDGLMPWRGRPDSLKRGMIARIPPFDFTEEKS